MAEKLTVPVATAVHQETGHQEAGHDEAEPLAAGELLVEEVSIDGMCGVY